MQIKKGNTAELQIALTDDDGNTVTNLSTASAVKFMMKINKKDTDAEAVVSKSIGDGVTIDSPSTGTVSIALSSTDTDITPRNYWSALQIEYPASLNEVDLSETDGTGIERIEITQDIIDQ